MNYTIIVGLFATILAVSAMPNGNYDSQCVQQPKQWGDAMDECFKGVSEATFYSLMTYNKTRASRAAKCLAECIYTKSGELVPMANGQFNAEALAQFLRDYVGSHYLLEELIETHVHSIRAANAEKGDNCDKAYAYHAGGGELWHQLIITKVFCQGESSK